MIKKSQVIIFLVLFLSSVGFAGDRAIISPVIRSVVRPLVYPITEEKVVVRVCDIPVNYSLTTSDGTMLTNFGVEVTSDGSCLYDLD